MVHCWNASFMLQSCISVGGPLADNPPENFTLPTGVLWARTSWLTDLGPSKAFNSLTVPTPFSGSWLALFFTKYNRSICQNSFVNTVRDRHKEHRIKPWFCRHATGDGLHPEPHERRAPLVRGESAPAAALLRLLRVARRQRAARRLQSPAQQLGTLLFQFPMSGVNHGTKSLPC